MKQLIKARLCLQNLVYSSHGKFYAFLEFSLPGEDECTNEQAYKLIDVSLCMAHELNYGSTACTANVKLQDE